MFETGRANSLKIQLGNLQFLVDASPSTLIEVPRYASIERGPRIRSEVMACHRATSCSPTSGICHDFRMVVSRRPPGYPSE